jgi:hypothetical protein
VARKGFANRRGDPHFMGLLWAIAAKHKERDNGDLAGLPLICNQGVTGSNPVAGTTRMGLKATTVQLIVHEWSS